MTLFYDKIVIYYAVVLIAIAVAQYLTKDFDDNG